MVSKVAGFSMFLLRVAMGVLFLYAGFTKVLDLNWSAKGYLLGAKTFSSFYLAIAGPQYLSWVNFLNMWGLTAIGVMLIVGIGVMLASFGGFILMMLYYFPVFQYPYFGEHYYIVD